MYNRTILLGLLYTRQGLFRLFHAAMMVCYRMDGNFLHILLASSSLALSSSHKTALVQKAATEQNLLVHLLRVATGKKLVTFYICTTLRKFYYKEKAGYSILCVAHFAIFYNNNHIVCTTMHFYSHSTL